MKKVTLREPVTFWPDCLAPYKLTFNPGEQVFILLDEGEKVLLTMRENPTAGETRWVSRELVKQ